MFSGLEKIVSWVSEALAAKPRTAAPETPALSQALIRPVANVFLSFYAQVTKALLQQFAFPSSDAHFLLRSQFGVQSVISEKHLKSLLVLEAHLLQCETLERKASQENKRNEVTYPRYADTWNARYPEQPITKDDPANILTHPEVVIAKMDEIRRNDSRQKYVSDVAQPSTYQIGYSHTREIYLSLSTQANSLPLTIVLAGAFQKFIELHGVDAAQGNRFSDLTLWNTRGFGVVYGAGCITRYTFGKDGGVQYSQAHGGSLLSKAQEQGFLIV